MNSQVQRLLNQGQFKSALKLAEKLIYLGAYTHSGFSQSGAAKLLGVSRGTFINKMKSWR